MSPAATTYLLKEDGTLNHGHTTQGSPTIVQWHRATAYHRDDPHAHSRCDSWNTQSEWSRRSTPRTRSEREQLIRDAREAHDKGVNLPPSTTRTATATTQYATTDTDDTAMHAHEVPASTTVEGDADLGTAILKQVASRLDEVEEAAIASLTTATEAKETASALTSKVNRTHDVTVELGHRVITMRERIDALEAAAERKITYEVRSAAGTTTLAGTQHKKFADLLELMSNLDPEDRNIWITGPAGSGKTTGARNLAKLLFGDDAEQIKKFYRAQGAIASPFQITGFMNAGGTYVGTPFRHIYENGGVILLDECDGSSANALLEINGATANGEHSFPDQMVTRHPDCYILAAANTWGFGGDANYMGRNKLDDATLDRFLTLDWGYDYELETAIAPHAEWCKIVQAARKARDAAGAKILITPRATLKGGKLLNGGVKPALVVEAIFGRNRDKDGKLPAFLQPVEAWARNYTRPTTATTPAPRTQASPPLPTPINSVNFSGVR